MAKQQNQMAIEEFAEEVKRNIEEAFSTNEERYAMFWAIRKIIIIKSTVKTEVMYEWLNEVAERDGIKISEELFVNDLSLLDEYFNVFSTRVGQSDTLKQYTKNLDEKSMKELKDKLSEISRKKEPWQMSYVEKYEAAMEYLTKFIEEIRNLPVHERDKKWAEMLCYGLQEMFQIEKIFSTDEYIAYRDGKNGRVGE